MSDRGDGVSDEGGKDAAVAAAGGCFVDGPVGGGGGLSGADGGAGPGGGGAAAGRARDGRPSERGTTDNTQPSSYFFLETTNTGSCKRNIPL